MKGMQVNLYICYGTQLDISTANQTLKKFSNYPDFYSFIYANGLQYVTLENQEHPTGYIIGKILNYSLNFVTDEIIFEDNIAYIVNDGQKIPMKLSRNEEIEINNKLYKIGIPPFTKYFLCQNFYKHY